jgi:hypothetical protein
MKPFIAFLKSVFSEPDGTGSASRILTFCNFAVAAFCLVYAVVHLRNLPEGNQLIGWGTFVTSPYAFNKAADAVKNFGKGPEPPKKDS